MGFPVASPLACSSSLGGPVASFSGREAESSSSVVVGGLKFWGGAVSVGLWTSWEEVIGVSLLVGEGSESSLELYLLSFWSSSVGSMSSTSRGSGLGLLGWGSVRSFRGG
jgi:hypothetical protein